MTTEISTTDPENLSELSDKERLALGVGGLLYAPAIREIAAGKLLSYPCLTSMAFCLEDAVLDNALEDAEQELCRTLDSIEKLPREKIPLIFVRVRTPEHLSHVHKLLSCRGYTDSVVAGYILPKFDLTNCYRYRDVIQGINSRREKPVYVMPILESRMIADISIRAAVLTEIKCVLDSVGDYVLNVRVGGNDFSALYGLRRSVSQNLYQISVIRDILSDVINVFAADYVVSGAVWEYFGKDSSEAWAKGLKAELELDRLNGFLGKTAIHPCQLPLIYDSMRVSREDYDDAVKILSWNEDKSAVEKSACGGRMNEVKCHTKWAKRIVGLAEIYGIRENPEEQNGIHR